MISATRLKKNGFTLIELVIVLVLIGILGAYVATTGGAGQMLSVPSQAETLASNIRHLQTQANASGKRMGLTVSTGSYLLGECTGTTGCASIINTTSVPVEQGVALSGPALYFSTLGQPSAAASYTLSYDGYTYRVSVDELTGFVTVTGI